MDPADAKKVKKLVDDLVTPLDRELDLTKLKARTQRNYE